MLDVVLLLGLVPGGVELMDLARHFPQVHHVEGLVHLAEAAAPQQVQQHVSAPDLGNGIEPGPKQGRVSGQCQSLPCNANASQRQRQSKSMSANDKRAKSDGSQ